MVSPLASTEASPDTWEQLIQIKSIKCLFTDATRGDWDEGKLTLTPAGTERLELHFDAINTKLKTARLIGNQGAGDVAVFLTESGLNFVEVTLAGSVNLTTVFGVYKKHTKEFIAVTSRHLLLSSGNGLWPFPGQIHGSCLAWQ